MSARTRVRNTMHKAARARSGKIEKATKMPKMSIKIKKSKY